MSRKKTFLDAYREGGRGLLGLCRDMKLTVSDVEKWISGDAEFAKELEEINRLRVFRVKLMLVENLERIGDSILEEAMVGKQKIQAAKFIFSLVDPPKQKKSEAEKEDEGPEPLADAEELRKILGS